MWSVTNYEGQYAFGTSGVLTNAMFELCRAVNERQHALDVVVTQFKDKDGNLGSDLELEDFVGMFVTGENNHFRYNCTQIMNWIRVAVAAGWFMEEPSASSTQWTPTSMMADIGLGTSWLSGFSAYYPSNVCDYVFYQRCQEALNRMTYVVARNRYDNTTAMDVIGTASDTGYSTFATAWSNRGDFPYSSPVTGSSTLMEMGMPSPGAILFWGGIAVSETELVIPYSKDKYFLGASVAGLGNNTLSGSITESYVAVNRTRAFSGVPGSSVSFGDWTVGGATVPYPVTTLPESPLGGGIFLNVRLHETSAVSLTDDFSIHAVLDEPASFSVGVHFRDSATVQFVEVYVDISSELSDQT